MMKIRGFYQKCFSLTFMCRFFTDNCQDKLILIRWGSVLPGFHMKPQINFIDFLRSGHAQKTLEFVVTVRIINRYNLYFPTPWILNEMEVETLRQLHSYMPGAHFKNVLVYPICYCRPGVRFRAGTALVFFSLLPRITQGDRGNVQFGKGKTTFVQAWTGH